MKINFKVIILQWLVWCCLFRKAVFSALALLCGVGAISGGVFRKSRLRQNCITRSNRSAVWRIVVLTVSFARHAL